MFGDKCKKCPDRGYREKHDMFITIANVELKQQYEMVERLIKDNNSLRELIKELESIKKEEES
jgi:hypothetical protein